MEIWVDVFGYEGLYKISCFGEVISLPRIDAKGRQRKERKLKFTTTKDGYKTVNFWKNKKAFHIGVHRVVWESFNKQKIPPHLEVNHMNGVRDDNRIGNLELLTHLENIKYSKEVLKPNYTSYGNRRLTQEQVNEIRQLYKSGGITQKQLASMFNTSKSNIQFILAHKSWYHDQEAGK